MKIIDLINVVSCSQIPIICRYCVSKHYSYYLLSVNISPIMGKEFELCETTRGEEKKYKSMDAVLADIIRIEQNEFADFTFKIQIQKTEGQ